MKTKKQAELLDAFLSTVGDELEAVFKDIADHLCALGYHPQKSKSNLIFKHDAHNKQIAKMGMRTGKQPHPFFSLRFSACRGYSKRIADVVAATIVKYPTRAPRCPEGQCDYCAGEALSHVYTEVLPNGDMGMWCGAYAMEIPDLCTDDLPEIRRLIGEEHDYLMVHEAMPQG